jgi:hypothetical protein
VAVNRRRFLAAGAGTLAALGGCSFGPAGSPDPLGPPTVEQADEGTQYYDFERAGEPALDIDIGVPGSRRSAEGAAGVVLEVTPYGDRRTTAVRWVLQAPPGDQPGTSPARVFATTASAGGVSVERAGDGATAVVIDGLSSASTLVVRARVVPQTPVEELAVRVEVAFDGPGRPRATVDDTLILPVRD